MDWILKHIPLLSITGGLITALIFFGVLYARFEELEEDMLAAYERLLMLEARFNGIPARVERAERDIDRIADRVINHITLPHVYRQKPPAHLIRPYAPE